MKPTKVASSLIIKFRSPEEGEIVTMVDGTQAESPAVALRAVKEALGYAYKKRNAIESEVKKLKFFASKMKPLNEGIATSFSNLSTCFKPQYVAKQDAIKKAEAALAFAIMVENTLAIWLDRMDREFATDMATFNSLVEKFSA